MIVISGLRKVEMNGKENVIKEEGRREGGIGDRSAGDPSGGGRNVYSATRIWGNIQNTSLFLNATRTRTDPSTTPTPAVKATPNVPAFTAGETMRPS